MLFPFIYKAKRDKVKLFVGFYGISLAESDHHYGKKAQVQKSVAGHHEDLTKYLRRNGYFSIPGKTRRTNLCVWRRDSLRSSSLNHSEGNLENRRGQWDTGQQHTYHTSL